MDVLQHHHQDPFISDMHSPSPSSTAQLNFTPYDSFDFNTAGTRQPSPSAHHFPHTPSYNGSYQNSPYSAQSELSYDPNDLNIDVHTGQFVGTSGSGGLFDNDTVGITVEGPESQFADYDPTDYESHAADGGLLLFGSDFTSTLDREEAVELVSVAVTPPMDQNSPHSFDHSSPASSYDGQRSRASSVSSQGRHRRHFSSGSQHGLSDFSQMSFEGANSPGPNSNQLFNSDRPSPPPHKPQSPPQLVIPDSAPMMEGGMGMPTINAPEGEGGAGMGPHLNIVPATPVSGGGVGAVQTGFQETLEGLQAVNSTSWQPQSSLSGGSSTSAQGDSLNVPFTAANMNGHGVGGPAYVFPGRTQPLNNGSVGTASQNLSVNTSPPPTSNSLSLNTNTSSGGPSTSGSFLIPQSPSRMRSKSDTSVRPIWNGGGGYLYPNSQQQYMGQGQNQQSQQSQIGQHHAQHDRRDVDGSALDIDIEEGGVNLSDVSPQHSPSHSTFGNLLHSSQPGLTHGYSFGPPSSGDSGASGYLSPEASGLRRARSDGSSRMGHVRMVRSEDLSRSRGGMGLDMGMDMDVMSGMGMGGMDMGNMGMGGGMDGMSMGGMGMYPPSSHQDFISLTRSSQYLHPHHNHSDSLTLPPPNNGMTLPLPSIGRGRGRSSGHSRRASSGSRSPYPSPSASPRMGVSSMGAAGAYDAYDSGYEGYDTGDGVVNVSGLSRGIRRDDGGSNELGLTGAGGNTPPSIPVSKQNVTTHATKDASERRRKTDANFVCPVPGCGSTFTRGFNLKGHLRSHTDDRPFQCKWPGCEKSFARQHDCKRHEALHLGVRDFKCGGCQKEFARMDALNRHLRSEGGVECSKLHQEAQDESMRIKSGSSMSSSPFPKSEPGEGWPGMGGMMM